MSLAERIKEAREDKKWNKAELMRQAKLRSPSTITELENGTITESPQLPKIAAALGVEVMWLQHGTGPKHRSGAKTIELSPTAIKIAMAANEHSEAYQDALLTLITEDLLKKEGRALIDVEEAEPAKLLQFALRAK